MVRRLNIDGDGQGDLRGHGGEQRAVYLYQIDAYRYWEKRLGRSDFNYGQFGENFTVEGLADDQVCIGDRYRIGGALFEVTQPRVTCYRVGIRMNEPRMAALLTGSGKPGFYLRVLEEGEVGAGDEIIKAGEDQERMTVAEINALLYGSDHPRTKLEAALRIKALSPGWQGSFDALLKSQAPAPQQIGEAEIREAEIGEGETAKPRTGNAALAPASAAQTAKPGFRPLTVSRIERECTDVISFLLEPTDRPSDASERSNVSTFQRSYASAEPLTRPLPGQFIVLRLRPKPDAPPLFRSYSLSGPPTSDWYRISVKIEPHGAAGAYLSTSVREGDTIDTSAPRGSFVLLPGDDPVVLLSAGIGATPVMAMLHALASSASPRDVWWLHGSRNRKSHPFALEAARLVRQLQRARSHIRYSRPDPEDKLGQDFDDVGHLAAPIIDQLGVPRTGDFYICGPTSFMHDLTTGLAAAGVQAERIHTEIFAGLDPITPGIADGTRPAPHLPSGTPGTGPLVSFARSGIAAHWAPSTYNSLLELAEACDVPVRWSCRTGVCHTCESGLVSGSVAYDPGPLDPPADGNVLICCSQPRGDVVIDI
jgi:ferredoxin-NADP reductase/MOSC domain-containing protein YiiM/ferredoxin